MHPDSDVVKWKNKPTERKHKGLVNDNDTLKAFGDGRDASRAYALPAQQRLLSTSPPSLSQKHLLHSPPRVIVAPSFKNITRYIPYVCPGIQFTHIVTNGVISKTMPLLHST